MCYSLSFSFTLSLSVYLSLHTQINTHRLLFHDNLRLGLNDSKWVSLNKWVHQIDSVNEKRDMEVMTESFIDSNTAPRDNRGTNHLSRDSLIQLIH